MASSSASDPPVILSEDDIPGASLAGRNPASLKNAELIFWLRCRGDSLKGLKTKAQLIKRVDEYLKTGRDKMVVDPDPDGIYSKRKARLSNLSSDATPSTSAKYPSDGWGKSLKRMPCFTRAEMNIHVANSGKRVVNTEHHSIPTNLRKAKTFLTDEYLKEIEANSDQRYFFLRAKCYHSFKKSEAPHVLRFALCIVSGQVIQANCSCKAGKVGFCNHVLALMFKTCKFSLFDCKNTDDLCEDDDEQPNVACTSQLQKWHKKGRGDKITAEPIMEIAVSKTKLDEIKSGEGVKCLLYDARCNPKNDVEAEMKFKNALKDLNPGMGLSIMAGDDSSINSFVDVKFGSSQVGSFCSYQLAHTEANFAATVDISAVPRGDDVTTELTYPRFPLNSGSDFVSPDRQSESEEALISSLVVDEVMINNIEEATRGQSLSERWKEERKYRLTASKFDLITKRQRNHDKFAADLMHPKQINSRGVQHGLKYEPIALQEYKKIMFARKTPVKVLKTGFVVCMEMPFLGGSPDGRVIDFGCQNHFGLAEAKCPETKYHVTPLEACQDPSFFCETVSGHCKLKRNHAYYTQVQGQMGVSGASWCDFIIYTKKGISVERIAFDATYWSSLKQKLHNYYFTHFIKTAAGEFAKC
ncbi:hypothetical protein P5673_033198 [Acropora cervicornis]|uniref:SWIM-type domain-containing protein n=1 Tax=Acropora cervicornis TaxID=6130 RepID=A0AAD9UR99_ACRCE|nr:hypothetical protein P5673_033198 [Acropora cervicornis]